LAQEIKVTFKVNGLQAQKQLEAVAKGIAGVSKSSKNLKGTATNINLLSRATQGLGSSVANAANQIKGFIGLYVGFNAVRSATSNLLNFNKAIAEVNTIARLNGKELKAVQNTLIDLSSTYGKSATETARTFYQVQSAGITDTASALSVTNAASKLAVAGLGNVESTVTALTKSLAVYGDTVGGDVTKVSDIFFRTIEVGQLRLDDLSQSLPQIAGLGKTLGLSLSEVSGALAAMSKVTGSVEIGTTQLNAIFSGVIKNQRNAKKILGENAKLFSLQALETKGLTGFLKDLTGAVGGNIQKLQELFPNVRGLRGLTALAADGFKSLGDSIEAVGDNAGAAQKAFEVIQKSISFQANKLRQNISNLVLKFTVEGDSTIATALQNVNMLFDQTNERSREIVTNIKAALLTVGAIITGSLIKSFILTGLGLKKLGVDFALMATQARIQTQRVKQAFALARTNISTSLAISGASMKTFAVTTRSALTLANAGLKGFIVTLKASKIAVASFKAVASLGFSLVLDFLIVKLLESKDALNNWSNVWKNLKIEISKIMESLKIIFANTTLSVLDFITKTSEGFTKFLNALGFSVDATVQFEGATKAMNDTVAQSKKNIVALTQEQIALKDSAKKAREEQDLLTNSLVKASQIKGSGFAGGIGGNNAETDPEQDARVKAEKAALAKINQLRAEQAIVEQQALIAQDLVDDDVQNLRLEKLIEQVGREQAIRLEAERTIAEGIKDEQQKSLKIQELNAKQAIAIRKGEVKAAIAADKLKSSSFQANLQATSNALNAFGQLAATGGKKFFGITKALALANIPINIAAGIAKAQELGFPANVIQSAAVAATGAAQLITVGKSKPPSFQGGGVLPANGGSVLGGSTRLGDRSLFFGNAGETLLNEAQTSNIVGKLQNGSDGELLSQVVGLLNQLITQDRTIEIDGREIAVAVRDQVQQGFAI
jgi:TP901 family phage tail tape measure protein